MNEVDRGLLVAIADLAETFGWDIGRERVTPFCQHSRWGDHGWGEHFLYNGQLALFAYSVDGAYRHAKHACAFIESMGYKPPEGFDLTEFISRDYDGDFSNARLIFDQLRDGTLAAPTLIRAIRVLLSFKETQEGIPTADTVIGMANRVLIFAQEDLQDRARAQQHDSGTLTLIEDIEEVLEAIRRYNESKRSN